MSTYYTISSAEDIDVQIYDTFILADGSDDRTLEMAKILNKKGADIHTIVLLKYQNDKPSADLEKMFPSAQIIPVIVNELQTYFLAQLINISDKLSSEKLIVDISCIHTPEMFVLLKYLKTANPKEKLDIAYSTPFEYDFPEEPFTSYCSYYGNLKTTDLLGFGGISDGLAHSRMIIFLGFEGVLASKVTEDIQYEELLLVNNLPSFFPKYKDICVINNYDFLSTHRSKLLYVPANNPFETFNFLDSVFDGKSSLCVAPLSTKPVALGVCLYAMSHKTLRIVYPTSEHYNDHRTNKVLNTNIYSIPLQSI